MPPLTDGQRDVITYVEQQWMLTGKVVSPMRICDNFISIPEHVVAKWFTEDGFRKALTNRGIPVEVSLGRPSGSLTAEQLLVANSMLDFRDNRSQKKKLADLGIESQTYSAWLKNDAFQSYIRERSEQLLNENSHEVNIALLDRARSGDTNAVRLYLGYTGRYAERADSTSAVDVAFVLTRVLEIIQKYVVDENTLTTIASEFSELAANGSRRAPREIEATGGNRNSG